MPPAPVLVKVTHSVRIPGFAEIKAQDMRLDIQARKLVIRTPEGIITFGEEEEDLRIQALDLTLPAILREQMLGGGWEAITMGSLVTQLYLSYLSDM